MPKTIAFLFIGQSPRPDIMDDIRAGLDADFTIHEYGAMDGLSAERIAEIAPKAQEDTLITRLKDGAEVQVSAAAIETLLEKQVTNAADDGAVLCVIMCTGNFSIKNKIPVITADDAFHKLQTIPEDCRKIGIIVPKAEQQKVFSACYSSYGRPVICGAADPYGNDGTIAAEGMRLASEGADLICLDCMGFTPDQAEKVRMACGKETRVPRTEIIKAIKEII